MEKKYNKEINKTLFSIDHFTDFSEEDELKIFNIFQNLIREFGDQDVFDELYEYLKSSINEKRDCYNFIYSFYNFGGANLKVKNPYPFLATLFTKSEFSNSNIYETEDEKNAYDTFDSIYTGLLIKSGIINEEDYFYVDPCTDDNLLKAIEELEKYN